jgi:hypothetical protein
MVGTKAGRRWSSRVNALLRAARRFWGLLVTTGGCVALGLWRFYAGADFANWLAAWPHAKPIVLAIATWQWTPIAFFALAALSIVVFGILAARDKERDEPSQGVETTAQPASHAQATSLQPAITPATDDKASLSTQVVTVAEAATTPTPLPPTLDALPGVPEARVAKLSERLFDFVARRNGDHPLDILAPSFQGRDRFAEFNSAMLVVPPEALARGKRYDADTLALYTTRFAEDVRAKRFAIVTFQTPPDPTKDAIILEGPTCVSDIKLIARYLHELVIAPKPAVTPVATLPPPLSVQPLRAEPGAVSSRSTDAQLLADALSLERRIRDFLRERYERRMPPSASFYDDLQEVTRTAEQFNARFGTEYEAIKARLLQRGLAKTLAGWVDNGENGIRTIVRALQDAADELRLT